MTLTPKESSLLKDLRAQEQICVDKYTKYAADAKDGQLKNLFSQIAQTERNHVSTLDQLASGTVPNMNTGTDNNTIPNFTPSSCSAQEKQCDAYLCSDALSMEKFVSSSYNTGIFEFTDTAARDALNHIQKEEQKHGEMIWKYMSVNGMYS